jgi:hypothetical protein
MNLSVFFDALELLSEMLFKHELDKFDMLIELCEKKKEKASKKGLPINSI